MDVVASPKSHVYELVPEIIEELLLNVRNSPLQVLAILKSVTGIGKTVRFCTRVFSHPKLVVAFNDTGYVPGAV